MKNIAIQIKQQRKYEDDGDDQEFSVVRLHNSHINSLGGTNNWVKIKSQKYNIYRQIKGAGDLRIPLNGMQLDKNGLIKLGWSEKISTYPYFETDLEIRKASWFERKISVHTNHPDPTYSMAMKLGLIGFILGFLGFLISFYDHLGYMGLIASLALTILIFVALLRN